jgi:hypothetical protein
LVAAGAGWRAQAELLAGVVEAVGVAGVARGAAAAFGRT